MQNHIIVYFLQKRTFPIHGLGILKLQHLPAHYSAAEQCYMSPTQKVVFEPNNSTDASSFVSFLVERCKIDILLARQFCENLANAIKQLGLQEKLSIAHAGYFAKDSKGETEFHSFVLPDVFYPPVAAKKVTHPNDKHTLVVGDTEVTNDIMNELLTKPDSEKQYNWWIAAACLMMVAVSIFLVYYFKAGDWGRFGNRQSFEIKVESPTYQSIK